MEKATAKHVEIYTESTPNPDSLKFVLANHMVLAQKIAEFKNADEAESAPLAKTLFTSPFVASVFISNNFITISKKPEYEWYEITPELKELIKQHVRSGKEAVSSAYFNQTSQQAVQGSNDIETKIIELLDKYVKPAIEMDGGHIAFKSFDEGKVTLSLQGACSGCPSSMVTLKSGIEGLLKRMVPEVEEVIADQD